MSFESHIDLRGLVPGEEYIVAQNFREDAPQEMESGSKEVE